MRSLQTRVRCRRLVPPSIVGSPWMRWSNLTRLKHPQSLLACQTHACSRALDERGTSRYHSANCCDESSRSRAAVTSCCPMASAVLKLSDAISSGSSKRLSPRPGSQAAGSLQPGSRVCRSGGRGVSPVPRAHGRWEQRIRSGSGLQRADRSVSLDVWAAGGDVEFPRRGAAGRMCACSRKLSRPPHSRARRARSHVASLALTR